MAITSVLITGKVVIPGTTIGVRAKITATPLTTNGALPWPADDTVSWGPASVETGNDGTIPAPGLAIPLDATVAGDLLWRFVATPIDRKDLKPWQMGTFPITVATTIADLVSVETVVYTPAQVATFAALLEAAETNATAAAASATAADGWADAAASSAADADSSADLAALSETAAETAASTATTQAGNASTSASTASTAATTATGAASSATTSAATATTKAAEASTSATAAQGHAASAAGSVSLVAWAPATAYVTGDVRQAPDGTTVRRNANGTSAASFDAGEQATWTAIGAVPGTMEQLSLSDTLVPQWKADVVHAAGDLVASPRGVVGRAKSAHTAADDYDPFKWDPINTGPGHLAAAATAQMRPTSFVKIYNVDGSIAADAPALGIYKTIGSATTALTNDVKLEGSNAPADTARATPARWRSILVAPGTYTEDVGLPLFCVLRGTGSKPSDVIVTSSGAVTGATLTTTGGSGHVSNLRVVDTSTTSVRHALRDGGPNGAVEHAAGRQRRTVIFDNVEFRSSTLAEGGAAAVDCTPGAGAFLVFNRCVFESPGQAQAINLVLNTGGAGTAGYAPTTVVFIDAVVICNKQEVIPEPNPVESGDGFVHPIGLVDFGSGRADRFFWYGGTFDVRDYYGPVAGDLTLSYQPVSGTSQTVRYYIDPMVDAHPQNVIAANVLSTADGRPGLPLQGLDERTHRAYFPDAESDPQAPQTLAATPSTAIAQGALTAGRIYYVKVPISVAMRPLLFTIGVGTAGGGTVASGYYLDNGGVPSTDGNMRAIGSVLTLVDKNPVYDGPSTFRRIWPGLGYVWLAFAVSSATSTVDRVADASVAGLTVKYKDGWDGVSALGSPTGLSDLAAGEPAPILTMTGYNPRHARYYAAGVTGSGGHYPIPAGAKALDITLIAGGGGGGAGRRGPAGSVRTGGGGGAPGGVTRLRIPVDRLSTRILQFVVGAKGAGAAAVTTDATSGGNGGAGADTLVRDGVLGVVGTEFARAAGGPGGAGGQSGAGGAGGTAVGGTDGVPGNGGSADTTGAATAGAAGGASFVGPGAGGAGGGITAGNGANAGGLGGNALGRGIASAGAGGAVGVAGGVGSPHPLTAGPGAGGGGGGAHASTAAGAGGNGGKYGAGGGGGGASVDGQTSGKGGDGGDGMAVVIPIF